MHICNKMEQLIHGLLSIAWWLLFLFNLPPKKLAYLAKAPSFNPRLRLTPPYEAMVNPVATIPQDPTSDPARASSNSLCWPPNPIQVLYILRKKTNQVLTEGGNACEPECNETKVVASQQFPHRPPCMSLCTTTATCPFMDYVNSESGRPCHRNH